MITDQIWEVLGPVVESCRSKLGPEPELPDRMIFEAVLYWRGRAAPGATCRRSSAPGTPSRTGSAAGAIRSCSIGWPSGPGARTPAA